VIPGGRTSAPPHTVTGGGGAGNKSLQRPPWSLLHHILSLQRKAGLYCIISCPCTGRLVLLEPQEGPWGYEPGTSDLEFEE